MPYVTSIRTGTFQLKYNKQVSSRDSKIDLYYWDTSFEFLGCASLTWLIILETVCSSRLIPVQNLRKDVYFISDYFSLTMCITFAVDTMSLHNTVIKYVEKLAYESEISLFTSLLIFHLYPHNTYHLISSLLSSRIILIFFLFSSLLLLPCHIQYYFSPLFPLYFHSLLLFLALYFLLYLSTLLVSSPLSSSKHF